MAINEVKLLVSMLKAVQEEGAQEVVVRDTNEHTFEIRQIFQDGDDPGILYIEIEGQ